MQTIRGNARRFSSQIASIKRKCTKKVVYLDFKFRFFVQEATHTF